MMTFGVLIFSANLLWVLGAAFVSLIAGTLARIAAVRNMDPETRNTRLASLKTWWVLALMVGSAVIMSSAGVCVLLAVASLLALREYSRMAAPGETGQRTVRLLYLITLLHYAAIYFWWRSGIPFAAPLALAFGVAAVQVLQGDTKDYIRNTAGLAWGAIVLVFGLSHAALLTTLGSQANVVGGPIGWFLFLIILTEINDIAQALVGRSLGAHKRHRIAPAVSPNKTWEGFLGGFAITLLLSAALAPWLTPLHRIPAWGDTMVPLFWPLVAGALIAVSGYLGDINMSAVKRDAGVKDSSDLLPGMGGVIDRIDSLTFTSPVFYYLVTWLLP